MSWREDLIQVYSKTPVAEIGTTADYVTLCDTYKKEPAFGALRHEVEMAKLFIEEFMAPPLTPQQQVRAALDLLMGVRRDKNRSLYWELIISGYRHNWSLAQKTHFAESYRAIEAEFDFFLSFTHQIPLRELRVSMVHQACATCRRGGQRGRKEDQPVGGRDIPVVEKTPAARILFSGLAIRQYRNATEDPQRGSQFAGLYSTRPERDVRTAGG